MKKIFIIIPIILLLICFYISINTGFVLAADDSGYEIEVSIPGGPTAGTGVGLASYIQYIYIFGLSLIGIAALGVLVYGGFMYMLSDTVVSKDDAKKYIWAAISGLILGLAAFLILNTINPDLTSLTLPNLPDLPELTGSTTPTTCTGTSDTGGCDSSKCEICGYKGGETKICMDKCDFQSSGCKTCEEGSCEPKEDGTICPLGACKDGKCKPSEDCTLTPRGCLDHDDCCSGLCYLQLCTEKETPKPDCIKPAGKGCVLGGTPCCEGLTCQGMKCKEKALTCEAGNCDSGCKTTANCEAWQDWNNNKCECEDVL